MGSRPIQSFPFHNENWLSLKGSLYFVNFLPEPAGGVEQVTILGSALATSFYLPRFCQDLGDLNVVFSMTSLLETRTSRDVGTLCLRVAGMN